MTRRNPCNKGEEYFHGGYESKGLAGSQAGAGMVGEGLLEE